MNSPQKNNGPIWVASIILLAGVIAAPTMFRPGRPAGPIESQIVPGVSELIFESGENERARSRGFKFRAFSDSIDAAVTAGGILEILGPPDTIMPNGSGDNYYEVWTYTSQSPTRTVSEGRLGITINKNREVIEKRWF